MGYTHYWSSNGHINKTQYAKAFKAITTIVERNKLLADGMGEEGTYPFLKGMIRFNGIGEDSHETFKIPEDPKHLRSDFCKTARKPYDKVVVACLTILHNYVSGIEVHSDGNKEDLEAGLKLARKILKDKTLVNMLDERPAQSIRFIKEK